MAPRLLPFARLRSDARSGVFVATGMVVYVGLVYAVIVLAGGRLIGQTGSPNLVLSILATATVAISFESVHARLEDAAAGMFHLRASPYEVLSRFAATTDADAIEDLPFRMAQLLAGGTGAAAAQVWLMVGDEPTLAASWPSADSDYPTGTVGTMHVTSAAPWRSLPVRDGGETLGLLCLQEHDQRPLTPVEERLFSGLAAQAGLVLRSARLRAQLSQRLVELSARADELHASRERLIETQDDERRRLERDIHDGAQQNLVALAVNLRLADTLLRRSRERAAAVMAQQSVAAQQAIDTLTQLSRGIYPALLAEEGLVPALVSIAGSSALPVELSADDGVRLPVDMEAALYFCCLEALQNAAKHSHGTCVRITFGRTPEGVHLSVSDDGVGFTAAEARAGAGTANMRDRIDAVGGTFAMRSTVGAGTCVETRIPVGATSGGPS
jgi:signal transduction histidine kinase